MPPPFPEQRLAILKAIENSPAKKLAVEQIQEMLPARLHHNLKKTVGNMRTNNLLSSTKENGQPAIYSLTDQARARLAGVPLAKRKYTRRKKPEEAQPPPPPPVNISTTANALADNITALISENAAYRELMISVYDMIAKRLELKTSKDQDNGA